MITESQNQAAATDALLERQREVIYPIVSKMLMYGDHPLAVREAKGLRLWDVEGREYLDFFGGILTVSVGHCNDEVTEATIEQLKRVQHTSSLYLNEITVRVAEKIAQITPGRLSSSFFTSSGSEANETAIMTARMYTGRAEVITLRHAYSGRTQTAMSLTGHASWRSGHVYDGYIKHVRSPYVYRAPLGLDEDKLLDLCVQDLEETLATVTDGKIAAFMAEPIQGVGGFIVLPRDYFKRILPIVREAGGLLIVDEVQTGWGRTGDHMCAIRSLGRRARHHGLRQGHRQRLAGRGDGDQAGDRRRGRQAHHRHLRRKSRSAWRRRWRPSSTSRSTSLRRTRRSRALA